MRHSAPKLAALAALAFVAGACAGEEAQRLEAAPVAVAPVEVLAAPRVLTVTAGDFYFQTARTIQAGMTTIRLVNKGPDLHHVQLIRLEKGHTVEELLDVLGKTHSIPKWATVMGGPNSPAPGGTSEVTLDLPEGEYAMVCVIPAADKIPHLAKGMYVPLTVTRSTASAAAPIADVEMVLDDYTFKLSKEITAGKHTIRVVNAAAQPHEVFIAKLAPGKNAGDLLEWIAKPQGPPPGMPAGGTSLIAKDGVNYVTAEFTPGEYGLYCFVPDDKDGRAHIAHGKIRQITIN